MDRTVALSILEDRIINAEALIWAVEKAVQEEGEKHSTKNINRIIAYLEMLQDLTEEMIGCAITHEETLSQKTLLKKEVCNA